MNFGDSSIFLIGYRGAGKSSVARELANRLGYAWTDSDDEIERRAGRTISDMFADEGESAFRDMEARVVAELAKRRRTVIALGGGAVLREENRRAIAAAGPVVWLTASVETIVRRMAGDDSTAARRPNLTTLGTREEVESLLAQRTPLYRDCATLVVDTEGKGFADVADDIVAGLQRGRSRR
jgi:shikimate kinase